MKWRTGGRWAHDHARTSGILFECDQRLNDRDKAMRERYARVQAAVVAACAGFSNCS
jgi:hypothetical protein